MAEHPLVQLARKTIEVYLRKGDPKRIEAALPGPGGSPLPDRAATFVSLHAHGRLRGCIGTLEPQLPSLREEVMQNSISAATRDPRFPPLELAELPDLEISVDVLTVPEAIDDEQLLDPQRYGVIVKSGWRRGVLLPDLEGVDTVEQQVAIARSKADIRPGEKVQLYRFEVRRFT